MADESDHGEEGLVDRLRESPRTVSAIIIILIVAAAIYAFSGDDTSAPVAEEESGQAVATEEELGEVMEDTEIGSVAAAETEVPTPLPEATRSAEGFVEVAQPGEGITHLARRATTQWLTENQADYEVVDEHRIYIEDYIQNSIGTEGLGLGETRDISFELMTEAVAAAGELNETQLQNLSQYTYVLQ